MHKTACCVMLMGLLTSMCAADALGGRAVVVKAGPEISAHVPVAVPYDAAAPDTGVVLVDKKTAASYPATIRDGQLVFVLGDKGLQPLAKAEEKHTFEVQVLEAAVEPAVVITKVEDADALEVRVNGEHFTTYHYSNLNKKPFLWPVHVEGGVGITRNFPMGPDELAHEDHVHHKSIWTSYGDLNGTDCWGEGGNSGFQHTNDVTYGSGAAYGWIHAKNVWQDKDHAPVIAEEREYRFYATPAGARLFDVTVTFTATEGPVKFGDTKEGGILSFRVRPEIEATKGRAGTIVNAQGATGERGCWGQPSPWCDYYGEIPGVGVRGIAVFDHPTNLRHPTRWHVRGYGLNGANCFGLSYFTEREQKKKGEKPLNGDYLLEADQSLTFNYRVMIHSGDHEAAQVADRFANYATPPEAQCAD